MSDVQVFEGDGIKPEDEFVSIPFGGFSVHANRKGVVTYHVFDRGHTDQHMVTRREFIQRTKLDDETIFRLEYGALAMRKHLNRVQSIHGSVPAQFRIDWSVEEKMKERAL